MSTTVHVFPGAKLRPTPYFGYPTVGAGRRVRPTILGVIHCTDGFGIPAPTGSKSWTFVVDPDGQAYQFLDPVTQTPWTNGDIKSPDTSNPLVAQIARSVYNPNEFCFLTIENICYVSGGQRLTAAQLKTDHEILTWGAKLSGLPLDREHVIGHYQINGQTRVNCPTVPADRQRVFDGVLGITSLPDTSVEDDMPLLRRKFEPWTIREGTKVYQSPSTTSAVIATLAAGPGASTHETGEIVDGQWRSGDWRQMELADREAGFVQRADLTPLVPGGVSAFDALVEAVLMGSDINPTTGAVTPPESVAAAAVAAATAPLNTRIHDYANALTVANGRLQLIDKQAIPVPVPK